MTAQQLKASILQLAIQGKLVPHNPADEPASILLKRIKAEKDALVKAGKLKKDKHESVITRSEDGRYLEMKDGKTTDITDEIPFDIPESWEWVRLGFIISLISGQDFPPSGYNDRQNGIPYITGASNMDQGKLIVNRWTTSPSSIALQGDLLITCKGAGVGKMALMCIPQAHVARQIMAIRPFCGVNNRFIGMFIQGNLSSVRKQMNGLIPGISRDVMLNILFPLPPLEEQNRIVAKIEELLPHIEEYGKAETALSTLNAELPEQLKKSILQWAIQGRLAPQDPNDEPASELLKRIKAEKAALIKSGELKKEKPLPPITEDEIPFDIPDNWAVSRIGDCLT